MPLSKEKQKRWMREYRQKRKGVIPKSTSVIPKSTSVIPKSTSVIPKSTSVIPNRYLLAHTRGYPEGFNPDGSYCKDYNPKLDPVINPMARSQPCVIPKYPLGILYSDGRVRLEGMSVVQPKYCQEIKLYKPSRNNIS